jgi:hypothetical protein
LQKARAGNRPRVFSIERRSAPVEPIFGHASSGRRIRDHLSAPAGAVILCTIILKIPAVGDHCLILDFRWMLPHKAAEVSFDR